jgi:hypothetical protein
MSPDRPPLELAFRSISRLLHWSGFLALTRPLANRVRLKIDREGRPAFPFVRGRRTRNAQILTYHRVNDDRDPYFGGTPTDVFERQMAYIASRFHVMSLSELTAGLRGEVPGNAIAVTLDDGYRDNYSRRFQSSSDIRSGHDFSRHIGDRIESTALARRRVLSLRETRPSSRSGRRGSAARLRPSWIGSARRANSSPTSGP